MKSKIICLCLLLAGFVRSQEVLDGVVAIVGDEIILRTEVIQNAQQIAMRMNFSPVSNPERFQGLMKDVLKNMIDEKVLLAKAKDDTITVSDQRVEQELDNRIQTFIQQLGSAERVEEYFGKPVSRIKREYRDDIKKQLIVQTYQAKELQPVQVSRREVQNFFTAMKDSIPKNPDRVKMRHILLEVKPGGEASEAAMNRIRTIRERLSQGEDFADLAREYSEDPGTAPQGGDLGYIERGTLFQDFERAAFLLEPGEVSEVVESPVGLHLIQMQDKRGDQVRVSHILIRLGVNETDESYTVRQIHEIRDRIMAGEDFSELARQYSDDETTRESGGDLGLIVIEELQIPEFKNAVDTLEAGEISQPFATQFGYHLVKVEDRLESRPLTLEEDWEQISAFALQAKQMKYFEELLEDLRKSVYIEIKEDLLVFGEDS